MSAGAGARRQRRDRRRAALLISVMAAMAASLLLLWAWGRQAKQAARSAAWGQPDASPEAGVLDELPEEPSREEVREPLRALRPYVGLCNTKGEAGVLRVHLTIKGETGMVTEATVTKQFEGTELARCATGLVEKAQFPRFRKKQFSVVYPFVLAARDAGAGDDGGLGEGGL